MIKFGVLLFFLWSAVDRICKTFTKKALQAKQVTLLEKLNSLLMACLYAGIAFDGLFSFLYAETLPSPFYISSGVVTYLIARYWRNVSIEALGVHWNIHTSAGPITRILTIGPFQYTRHPYYSATVLELVAYACLFGSARTAVLTFVVFISLMIFRLWLEEKNLLKKFPLAYGNYRKEVGVLICLPRYVKELRLMEDLLQILGIVKRFGFQQLVKIRFMSSSVSRYSRGYAVSRIAGAMIEIGLIEKLLTEGSINLSQFSQERHLDLDTLKILSDYFSVLGILKKVGLNYSLTAYGRRLFDVSRGIFTLLYAYMPVFESLPDILRKEKKYGLDIFRKGDFVGRGSAELAKLLPFPYATDILRRHHLQTILDLGCGSGDFLIHFCKENGFSGYGLDISPEVIAVAKKKAEREDVDSRVKFLTGDLHSLDKFGEEYKDVDVITLMFVLHECLIEGQGVVVKILKEIKKNFPRQWVFISEVCRWSIPQLTAHPVAVAEHHLFHKLSRQGLATVTEWKTIFRKAGFICVEERRFDRAAQAYFLLRSQSES